MSEIVYMVLAFIGGLALGMLFFGGLWLTTKKVITSKMPGILFSASFLIRAAITITGFYYISLGHWQRLLVCVLGYIVARFAVMHLTKRLHAKQIQLTTGGQNEA
jgi:F1F0 ATPase subunit 2